MGIGKTEVPPVVNQVSPRATPRRVFEDYAYAVSSIALPALLAHCGAIKIPAMVMSIVGGLLIYATIISFTMFFQEEEDF